MPEGNSFHVPVHSHKPFEAYREGSCRSLKCVWAVGSEHQDRCTLHAVPDWLHRRILACWLETCEAWEVLSTAPFYWASPRGYGMSSPGDVGSFMIIPGSRLSGNYEEG